jgi:hypothetical protein
MTTCMRTDIGDDYGYGTNLISLGEYIGNCAYDCAIEIYYDEVYADSTLSRVMIADSPSWSSVSDINMQIPSSWSDTSITVEFNGGAYSDGVTAYLYVADSEGNVNATGYPVTIAATSGNPSAPGRPQNMTVREN